MAVWTSITTPPSGHSELWRWAARTTCLAGSDLGGERAATIYSLIGTAKLNNLDPEAYLREVLTRIAEYPVNRIADLLPWNVAATKEVST